MSETGYFMTICPRCGKTYPWPYKSGKVCQDCGVSAINSGLMEDEFNALPEDEKEKRIAEIKQQVPENVLEAQARENDKSDVPSAGLNVLAFLLTFFLGGIGLIIGLIIFFVKHSKKPKMALSFLVVLLVGAALRLVCCIPLMKMNARAAQYGLNFR